MENVAQKISMALKLFRSQQGLSLNEVSKKTGISKTMLGQIERQESIPTITVLGKLVNGLNVPFSYFLADLEMPKSNSMDFNQHYQQYNFNNKIKITPIFAYDQHLKFEMFAIVLLPGYEHMSLSHQKGIIEHVIVSYGEVEVLVNDEWHTLKQHEGIRFNAGQSHGYRNATSNKAAFNNIIHYT